MQMQGSLVSYRQYEMKKELLLSGMSFPVVFDWGNIKERQKWRRGIGVRKEKTEKSIIKRSLPNQYNKH